MQERARKARQVGKLNAELRRQRATSDAEALKQASETERRQRDLDQSTAALNHS
jgi:hypothetical protein